MVTLKLLSIVLIIVYGLVIFKGSNHLTFKNNFAFVALKNFSVLIFFYYSTFLMAILTFCCLES